jgi:hypothetical protein
MCNSLRSTIAVAAFAAFAVAPAFAGNGAPSGAHYNLNIIGVAKGKSADMTDSNRHTIFVWLGNGGAVTSKIWLTRGDTFAVLDGNGTDNDGARFQLPCNTNLTDPDGEGPGILVPCTEGESAAYEVWARALGKPGGSATMTTCATEPVGVDVDGDGVTGETICSTENVVLVRNKGKSTFTNVTNELTSLLVDIDFDTDLDRVALFASGFEDWFWQYENKGLRLAQLRFYLLD